MQKLIEMTGYASFHFSKYHEWIKSIPNKSQGLNNILLHYLWPSLQTDSCLHRLLLTSMLSKYRQIAVNMFCVPTQ